MFFPIGLIGLIGLIIPIGLIAPGFLRENLMRRLASLGGSPDGEGAVGTGAATRRFFCRLSRLNRVNRVNRFNRLNRLNRLHRLNRVNRFNRLNREKSAAERGEAVTGRHTMPMAWNGKASCAGIKVSVIDLNMER